MGLFQEFETGCIKKARKTDALFMAPALLSKTGFEPGQSVNFRYGTSTARAKVFQLQGATEDIIYFSGRLFQRYPLIRGNRLRFYLDSLHNTIRIGPVVGLLTTFGPGGISRTYREWVTEAHKSGYITFIFNIGGVQSKGKVITGLIWVIRRGKGCWVKKQFPFPDVVYNQIRSRRSESLPSVRTFRQRFLALGNTHYFNRSFLNKRQVAEALRDIEELGHHLPETRMLSSYKDCLEMLERYPSIFLKPVHGSLGCGIIKFTRPEMACYRYQALTASRRTRGRAVAAESLAKVVRRLTAGRNYLIQQGIPLLTIGGRPFDIRVLIQKNSSGCWTETHMFAKIAAKGNFATNVAAGGMVASVHEALEVVAQQAGLTTEALAEQIRQLVYAVARAMDEKLGPFGELGLDIGIDTGGRVWLIEVNSKYSRHVFPRDVRRISIIRPLEYAGWLTGLNQPDEGESPESSDSDSLRLPNC